MQREAARSRPGASRRPREHVGEVQRRRILTAMGEVVSESGLEAATVAHVVARAGVSRRTFYDLFEDRQACFIAAFEEAVARASETVELACAGQTRWVDRLRTGLLALLVFFDEEPVLARVCVVHALAGGSAVLERRGELIRALAETIDAGRAEASGRNAPTLTAEGLVGAVLSVIHARLLEADPAPLAGLLGALMEMITLPYLGVAGARRELMRPAPMIRTALAAPTERPPLNPLGDLGMRVTYRTLRVLAVIAEHPGVSNREVGERAGVADQGQVSKLLGRLRERGLIDNTGEGHARGAPNAWSLSASGARLHRSLHLEGAA